MGSLARGRRAGEREGAGADEGAAPSDVVAASDVNPVEDGGDLVGPCGRSSGRNARARPAVSLLWPPNEPGDYSLIVDADMTVDGNDETRLARLAPTHAILHRPAAVPDPETDCAHDCQKVL